MKFNSLTYHVGLIIATWNNPTLTQAMLNKMATGWAGDPYAVMAHGKEQMAQTV